MAYASNDSDSVKTFIHSDIQHSISGISPDIGFPDFLFDTEVIIIVKILFLNDPVKEIRIIIGNICQNP
jgi:hypothetical protein